MITGAPNIENTLAFSCNRHPVEDIEPEAREDAAQVEALQMVLGEIFRTKKQDAPLRIEAAFRRFCGLVWLLRPDLMGGKSQTAMAETLGVTRSGLSKLIVFWSNKVGVINAGMKSLDARESFRSAQLGHGNYKLNGAKKANPIGTPKVGQFLVREEQRLENMRNQFLAGKQWRKPDRQLATRRGLTDADGQLTSKGAAWVEDTPTLGAPVPVNSSGVAASV